MAKSVRCEWYGFAAQHRWEDCPVIAREVLEVIRPRLVIELGTAEGGFAAFLSAAVAPWGGQIISADINISEALIGKLEGQFDNLMVWRADVLTEVFPAFANLIASPECQPCLVYCDDGNKPKELELYAPIIPAGSLVGCHDYEDEVPGGWVEPFLAGLGYAPFKHDVFEALAHPVDYPVSMSRFWLRVDSGRVS